MKILGYELVKGKEYRSLLNANAFALNYGYGSSYSNSNALTLSAVYRAVNLISDAIASLQMKVYNVDVDGYKSEAVDNSLYNILGIEPNPNMSRYNFFRLIIQSLLLRGNAYIKINRDSNFNILSLEFINPDAVNIYVLNGELKFTISGVKGYINNSDIIHILNFPKPDTLKGASTIEYAYSTLSLSKYSEDHATSWFENGSNIAGIFTTDATITPLQEKALKDKFQNNPNGIAFLGNMPNSNFSSLAISPRDSQLLETRQFNVLEIARFFNVNPILLFDTSKATYNNVENAQLDFLNTTLLPQIEKLENEFLRKLILPSQRSKIELRFDLSNLLRADMNSLADYYTKLVGIGVVNSNQVAKALNLPKINGTGGDKHFISTNLQDINNLIVNSNNNIDNKLK